MSPEVNSMYFASVSWLQMHLTCLVVLTSSFKVFVSLADWRSVKVSQPLPHNHAHPTESPHQRARLHQSSDLRVYPLPRLCFPVPRRRPLPAPSPGLDGESAVGSGERARQTMRRATRGDGIRTGTGGQGGNQVGQDDTQATDTAGMVVRLQSREILTAFSWLLLLAEWQHGPSGQLHPQRCVGCASCIASRCCSRSCQTRRSPQACRFHRAGA
jgi:hypothetical protein